MYNLNPRDIQKAMKRFGIKQDEISAVEVIIKCTDKDIIIKNPSVSKVNMMGNDMFQVTGEAEEVEKSAEPGITEEDVKTVMSHTNCTEEQALDALKKTKGNIAEAIMDLSR